jgi:hypothetical protein
MKQDTGNVGIGKTAPEALLDVSAGDYGGTPFSYTKLLVEDDDYAMITIGTPNTKAGYLYFADPESNTGAGIYFDHSINHMGFRNGGVEGMTFDDNRYLGLGTTDPGAVIDIQRAIAEIKMTDTDAGNAFSIKNNGGNLEFLEDTTARMYIKAGGNVGIGTTGPDADLEINNASGGTIRWTFGDSNGSATDFAEATTDANGGLMVTTTDGDGAAGHINLNPDGNVGIKTATPSVNADLTLEGGVLCLKETTTPTADANYAKIYTKTDNNLYYQDGAGTEHTILKGSSSVQHAFFTPLEDPTGVVGNWDIIEINSAQAVHFSCQIPEDFEVLDAATIVMIPDTTETIQWDIYVSVAAVGEAYNNDDRSALNQTLAVTASQLTEADISGQLTGLSAGDYIAIDFQSDTANLRIVGFEFDFN